MARKVVYAGLSSSAGVIVGLIIIIIGITFIMATQKMTNMKLPRAISDVFSMFSPSGKKEWTNNDVINNMSTVVNNALDTLGG